MAAFGNSEVSYFSELRNFTWSIKILSCRLVDTVQFLSDWNTWAKLVASSYTITQDALLLSKCLFEGILLFLNFAMWISKGTFSTSEVRMQFPNAANLGSSLSANNLDSSCVFMWVNGHWRFTLRLPQGQGAMQISRYSRSEDAHVADSRGPISKKNHKAGSFHACSVCIMDYFSKQMSLFQGVFTKT